MFNNNYSYGNYGSYSYDSQSLRRAFKREAKEDRIHEARVSGTIRAITFMVVILLVLGILVVSGCTLVHYIATSLQTESPEFVQFVGAGKLARIISITSTFSV